MAQTQTKTARSIMTGNAEVAKTNETVFDVAKRIAREDIGALPICTEDGQLRGMITDRDIVLNIVAQGRDPRQTRVEELASDKPVTIGADDSIEEAMQTMMEHKVRRLPVIDGHKLIGVISQADIAKAVSPEQAGRMLERISR